MNAEDQEDLRVGQQRLTEISSGKVALVEDHEVCGGCGSTHAERLAHAMQRTTQVRDATLRECQHCGADKCIICDMGDDVECGSCGSDDED